MSKMIKRAVDKVNQIDPLQIAKILKKQSEETELYETVLDSLTDGIIMTDSQHKVLYSNTVSRILLPIKRFKNSDDLPVQDQIADEEVVAFLQESFASSNQRVVPGEFVFGSGDNLRTVSVQVSAFNEDREFAPLNKASYTLIIANDITERKKAEARLRRSESLASLTQAASGVAHDIKNPLASIGIHLQLMRKTFERNTTLTLDQASHFLDVMQEEIDRLNGIVVDFLFAVRPMNVQTRLLNLNDLMKQLCEFIRPEYESHGMFVATDLRTIPKLQLDENLIKQVFFNMATNSEAAMQPGGKLTVSTKLDGNNVLLRFTDTGEGMTPQTLAKVFEPYFTTKVTGTGLGLTMVYKVIKEHGGEVSVASTVGQGTCFTFSLPVPAGQWLSLDKNGNNDIRLQAEEIGS